MTVKSKAKIHLYNIDYVDKDNGELYFGTLKLGVIKDGNVCDIDNVGGYVSMLRRDLGKVLKLMSSHFTDIEFPKLCVTDELAILSMFRMVYTLDMMALESESISEEGKYHYTVAEGLLWNNPTITSNVVDTDDYWVAEKQMSYDLLNSAETKWFAVALFDEPFDFNISLDDVVELYKN